MHVPNMETNTIFCTILYNKCVIFPKRYKLTVPTVSLDGNKLDYEDHIKYLGVVLSSDCRDVNDI